MTLRKERTATGALPADSRSGDAKCQQLGDRIGAYTIAILLGVLLAPLTGPVPGGALAANQSHRRPNIVLIQSDDQTVAQFNGTVMPRTERLLARDGTLFTNYIATNAQCCPSRASLLTGEYPHNHGVTSNDVGYAGLKNRRNVLPVWLRRDGYRTMHVGAKYMNGYEKLASPITRAAPGWSEWFTSTSETRYYDYRLVANGHLRRYDSRASDYITRVLGTKSKRLVKRYAPRARPFFLQLDERAPHEAFHGDPFGTCDKAAAVPDPRDELRFQGAPLPQPPSFNEKDMSDKPRFLRSAPAIDRATHELLAHRWDCGLASLRGVDRDVAKVFHAVKRSGELSNTVFVYLSDNGHFYGEHRIPSGKVFPYEEAIRQPLVIRMPERYRSAAPYPRTIASVAGNIDIAPTILALARATPCRARGDCRTMDGRSLLPLLRGSAGWPRGRALLVEYRDPVTIQPKHSTCGFAGIRLEQEIYVKYYWVNPGSGKCVRARPPQVERYRLSSDPFELDNLCFAGSPDNCPGDAEQSHLERRLRALRQCAGIKGRDRRVRGRPFCE